MWEPKKCSGLGLPVSDERECFCLCWVASLTYADVCAAPGLEQPLQPGHIQEGFLHVVPVLSSPIEIYSWMKACNVGGVRNTNWRT